MLLNIQSSSVNLFIISVLWIPERSNSKSVVKIHFLVETGPLLRVRDLRSGL